MEGDNREIMESLKLKCNCLDWSLSPLFDQIECAKASLEDELFNWVPRHPNYVAHSLRKPQLVED